ncbi:alpha/beta fold hydrolase [Streptomyces malaysiensis]|uniref:Alpha/beta hydrolase n=1 Tax=Streptomyces malaysiensis subsp. samsunensis TaxID=459658 RepID=A0A9X2LYP9_STRMQ|nr:alpha/beta hydrolase [Streptomyces samsunensis]MCQ8832014.1 alpha/beta hydrolase [Streptomyces samsunensis]
MEDGDAELVYTTAPDGAKIAAEVFVPARPWAATLLLVPGLGYGPWSFAPQRADLAAEYRLVLLHNRGTGQSDAPPGPYSIDTMADGAAAVLRSLGARRAHVVGTSMGGYISLQLASAHPDLVASVVMIASSPGGPGALPVPEETATLWRDHAQLPGDEFARQTMPNSFAPGWVEEHPREYAELLAARLASPVPPEAWAAQSAAGEEFLTHGVRGAWPDQPVTGIHGTADRVVPFENLAALGRRLPQAHLTDLQGAGHLCWLERPGDVNAVIRSHLASVGAATPAL